MTSPPPGPNPDDNPDDVPPQYIPPQQIPYGYPPPPPGYLPPPPGYLPPPPESRSRISIGMAFLGSLAYAVINLILGFMAFIAVGEADSQDANPNLVLGFAAVLLAAIAFGGGTLLLRSAGPHAKGLGIGLMIGWALVSLFSAGFCTGINPSMYA